ncbi:uncharacterized protein [Polyergus mexicanus]|uniref:uncharacterized protein n=1 Tax=Polyergus mexicanus TaxID=615972 RepID=UPI0038B6A8DD
MVSLSYKKRGHIRWDVLATASSVPNIHDKFAKPAGLRSAVMSLARVYITAFLLIFGTFCNTETAGSKKIKVNDSDSIERSVSDDVSNDTESAEQEQDVAEKIMPILPPIILLDFDNSATSGDNATADEKSKRTVNNHLGYGFDRNVLHASRKYNYYFPAGKTGTSVSIEESISPFLPRTIIEKIPSSSNRKPVPDSYTDLRSQPGSYEIRDSSRSNFQSPTSYQYYNPAAISQPVFGLRTKLMRTSDPERYPSFSSTTRPPVETYSNVDYRGGAYAPTTPQSLMPNSAETEAGYISPSPQSYTTFSSNRYLYVTPSPPSYAEVNSQRYLGQHAINVQSYTPAQSSVESSTVNPIDTAAFLENIGVQSKVNSRDYIRPTLNTVESSTSSPGDASSYAENAGLFANMPRYTVENGVRYENKIFWKYPDGRVSDTPPMTYETYSDYPSLEMLQAARSQDTSQIDESVSAKNGVLSQGPMQFPMSPKPSGPPTPFISAETLSRLSQQQAYRLGYQNLVGQKQIVSQQARAGNGVSSTYSTTSSPLRSSVKSNGKNQYETSRRPIPKYMVNSPNPEYIDSYTTESAPRSTTPRKGFISSIFYYVILMVLSWPQIRCTESVNLKNEEIFDQLATASENIVEAAKHSSADSKNPQEQISRISSESATIHYENSNGFVPMVSSVSPSYNDPDSSYDSSLEINDSEQQENQSEESGDTRNAVSAQDNSDVRAKKFEEDLAYSSEARIFLNYPGSLTNRRSFDFQEGRSNEFELLKVNNDTPAVANYQEFYKNVHSTVNTETDSESDTSSSEHPNEGRGKKIVNYAHNYGQQSQQANDENPYAQYSYNGAQDMKKITYEQEKVTDNYRQQNTANYDSHGQNAATVPSSSRMNYQVNEFTHSGNYDNVAESSRTHYRFKPVVVAESSNYKTDMNSGSDTALRNLKSSNSRTLSHYQVYNDNNRQRSYHRTEDSKNLSDESTDSEYIEQPRVRMQKTRRRPSYPDSSRKLSKEHRNTVNDSTEEDNHKYSSSKVRSQRYKVKTNPWLNDPSTNHNDESVEDDRYGFKGGNTETKGSKVHNGSRQKIINSWNQISPNFEVSQSNRVELDQMEKPKFLVNLVPVANFDHATALGSSQGFDMSNAVLQNVATIAPIGAFGTTAPLLSTPHPDLAQNLAQLSKNLVNLQNLAVSTPLPDIIVGQNTYQNPVHTVLLSHSNGQKDTLKTYLPSTVTPVFALTSSLSPALQNIRVQNVQSNNVTPRTASTVVPQPTLQTFPSFMQTPLQATQINSHGTQGQNLIHHGNLQIQSLPTTPTLLSGPGQTMPENRINMESQNKKNMYSSSGTNFLASASLAVGQNEQKQPTNVNSYYLQNYNTQQIKPQEIMPTILQPSTTLNGITQYVKLQNNGADAMQQLQLNKQLIKNHRLGGIMLQTADSVASHSNNVVNALEASSGNAHLPNVGTKNVEIVNPNIKPSPIDTTYQAMHYPATVLTTPIPIFSTIAPVNPQTVDVQNYISSLTENGNKAKQLGTVETFQNQEQPMFNPINFVPNIDIIKDQNALNNKLPVHEPIQQGLNLVPVMPGGNFFKPSYAAQSELVVKPKLASDLQNYAEEMFKESLKTMYNSQKWNNDRKPQENGQNDLEASDLAKLRLEMQKLRASLTESNKDILEAHQSMQNMHTTDAPQSPNGKKKPDPLLATLEHLLKTRSRGPIHIYHGLVKPDHKRKPEDSNFNYDEFKDGSHVREFLTPPKSKPLHSKNPFENKPKKRPGSLRFKNNSRKPARPSNLPLKSGRLETSSSDIHLYMDPDNFNYDSRHQPSFDRYSAFTTAKPNIGKILREMKSNNNNYDINHPRMHNLLGLLMKNKQLPTRNTQNYFNNKDQVKEYFESDKHRLEQQFYNNILRDYMNRSDIALQSDSVINKKVYSGNGTA